VKFRSRTRRGEEEKNELTIRTSLARTNFHQASNPLGGERPYLSLYVSTACSLIQGRGKRRRRRYQITGKKEGRSRARAQLTKSCFAYGTRRGLNQLVYFSRADREYTEDSPRELIIPFDLRILHQFPVEREEKKVSFRPSFPSRLPFLRTQSSPDRMASLLPILLLHRHRPIRCLV